LKLATDEHGSLRLLLIECGSYPGHHRFEDKLYAAETALKPSDFGDERNYLASVEMHGSGPFPPKPCLYQR
jgi:hypothetical protein